MYYQFGFSFNKEKIGIARNLFCTALKEEGIPCSPGYVKPLYINPLYLEKRAFAFKHYTGNVKYEKGICPVAESLYETDIIIIQVCRAPATLDDMNDIVNAIHKILDNKEELLDYQKSIL